MLSYNFDEDKFIDSGIAFNEDVNLLSNIDKKIQDYIASYFQQNPDVDVPTVLEIYSTFAKIMLIIIILMLLQH